MGIPLAALGVRTPQFKSPLDQMTKAVQLKSLLQGQQINQAQLQQFEQQQKAREQAQQEQERTQSLFREVGADWEEFFKKAPGRGISMETLLKLKESYRKDQQEYRAQSAEERLARKEKMALYSNESAAILAGPQEQRKRDFIQRVQGLVSRGSLTQEQAQQFAQLAQLPDEEFNRQLEMMQLSAVGATKLFEAEEKREAEKAKLTTNEKERQVFLKTYRESKGLPKNAKTEMQAMTSPEWKAWQGATKSGQTDLMIVKTVDDKGKSVTKVVPKVLGAEYLSPPTADMRNKAAARKQIVPAIDTLEQLGNRVITENMAAMQRARATGRSIDAALRNDPDYRTYQDARHALAGMLAVAQQGSRPSDADIKAVWIPLIPDVFKDTQDSAKMKWQMIRTISGLSKEKVPRYDTEGNRVE